MPQTSGGCGIQGPFSSEDAVKAYRAVVRWGLDPKGFHGEVLCGMGLVAMGKAPLYRDFIS